MKCPRCKLDLINSNPVLISAAKIRQEIKVLRKENVELKSNLRMLANRARKMRIADALLKELIEANETPPANEFPKKLYDILERAKRILESK